MEYFGLEKQDFFRQLVMTSQYTFHGHPETFLIVQFHCHFVTQQTTLENFEASTFKMKYHKSSAITED